MQLGLQYYLQWSVTQVYISLSLWVRGHMYSGACLSVLASYRLKWFWEVDVLIRESSDPDSHIHTLPVQCTHNSWRVDAMVVAMVHGDQRLSWYLPYTSIGVNSYLMDEPYAHSLMSSFPPSPSLVPTFLSSSLPSSLPPSLPPPSPPFQEFWSLPL